MRRGALVGASAADDIRVRNQDMLMNYTLMSDGALLEDPNNTSYARLAAHMGSIAEFASSKFPGHKAFYAVKLEHIKKEPLHLGLEEPWALSKRKACVWRYDKPRHSRYEMVATPHFAHEH